MNIDRCICLFQNFRKDFIFIFCIFAWSDLVLCCWVGGVIISPQIPLHTLHDPFTPLFPLPWRPAVASAPRQNRRAATCHTPSSTATWASPRSAPCPRTSSRSRPPACRQAPTIPSASAPGTTTPTSTSGWAPGGRGGAKVQRVKVGLLYFSRTHTGCALKCLSDVLWISVLKIHI